MPMDYKVFEPNDKDLAEIICRILEKRGYDAGYQRSYPQHPVCIKVDSPEIASEISQIIQNFMKKYKTERGGMVVYNYDESVTELAKLIPETKRGKRRKMVTKILEEIEGGIAWKEKK